MTLLIVMVMALLANPFAGGSPLPPGDMEFAEGRYPAAIAAYDSTLRATADSAKIFWRYARVHICQGDVAEKDQREGLYRLAVEEARISVRLDSSQGEGHTWLGASLGSIAMYEGSKSKVQLCTEIKDQLEKAIAINPRDDVAYSILGTFYMTLGNVSWLERQLARMFLGRLPDGGYDEAEAALLKAIALAPDVIRHHSELATLYRLRERTAEARVEYEKTVSLQPVLASDPRRQKAAQHWLETMEKED